MTADQVIEELHRRRTPVIRLDLADFPHGVELDAVVSGGQWTGTLATSHHRARLEEIAVVWWWHPRLARVATWLSPEEADWASAEANAGLAGVLAALDCLHVNHPVRTHAAQTKPGVLARAAAAGLAVPDTWVGNAPVAARDFAEASAHGAVVKSLVSPGIDHPDGRHSAFFTTPVAPEELDGTVALTAHQLQQRVPKAYEVRLTVVGGRLFAARLDAHSPAARRDFRAGLDAVTYRATELPDRVRQGVHQLMGHYGLCYAALDLLVDPEGRWWLVDLNPSGQYGWIEAALPELAITDALATLLTRSAPTPVWRAA